MNNYALTEGERVTAVYLERVFHAVFRSNVSTKKEDLASIKALIKLVNRGIPVFFKTGTAIAIVANRLYASSVDLEVEDDA